MVIHWKYEVWLYTGNIKYCYTLEILDSYLQEILDMTFQYHIL